MTRNPEGSVHPEFACPTCGEVRIDNLVWIDDDTVRCSRCGTEYAPRRPRRRPRRPRGGSGNGAPLPER